MLLPAITIDIGTTSVKLGLFDATGEPVAAARHPTPTTRDPWGEIYDLATLQRLVLRFVRGLDPDVRTSVRAITVGGVGESGGLVRPDVSLASPMILWHDHRGAGVLARLSKVERALVSRVTGLPVNANYALSKAAWAVDQAGGGLGDAQWLNIAEYLAAWMTGRRWSEPSLASRTMALDIGRGTWSPEVCALVGLDPALFPELRPASRGAVVTAGFAGRTDLPPDVTVHVAGHDHMVGAVGAGLRPGELLNSTGTTEGLLFLKDRPSLDDHTRHAKLANGIACAGGYFTLFASIPTGGSAFATLQTMLGLSAERLSARVDDLHETYLAGRVDLGRVPLVLPQFRGSAPPTKQSAARGIIAGIASDTTAADIVFGCFLGLARQFRDVLALFRTPVDTVKVIGPASVNNLWLQLKADLLNTPLSVSEAAEVVSRGAQALACGTTLDWERSRPHEVLPHADRAAGLADWCEATAAMWQDAKGFSA